MSHIDSQLIDAAIQDDTSRVRALLARGASALGVDQRGISALMWAAKNNYEPTLLALLPVSDAQARDNEGRTALMLAANAGSHLGVELLLDRSDALTKDRYGSTALILAVASPSPMNIKICSMLLSRSNAMAQDLDRWSALMLACFQGSDEIARLLLPHSDPSAVNNDGHTASMLARQTRHDRLADFVDAYALALREREQIANGMTPKTIKRTARSI